MSKRSRRSKQKSRSKKYKPNNVKLKSSLFSTTSQQQQHHNRKNNNHHPSAFIDSDQDSISSSVCEDYIQNLSALSNLDDEDEQLQDNTKSSHKMNEDDKEYSDIPSSTPPCTTHRRQDEQGENSNMNAISSGFFSSFRTPSILAATLSRLTVSGSGSGSGNEGLADCGSVSRLEVEKVGGLVDIAGNTLSQGPVIGLAHLNTSIFTMDSSKQEEKKEKKDKETSNEKRKEREKEKDEPRQEKETKDEEQQVVGNPTSVEMNSNMNKQREEKQDEQNKDIKNSKHSAESSSLLSTANLNASFSNSRSPHRDRRGPPSPPPFVLRAAPFHPEFPAHFSYGYTASDIPSPPPPPSSSPSASHHSQSRLQLNSVPTLAPQSHQLPLLSPPSSSRPRGGAAGGGTIRTRTRNLNRSLRRARGRIQSGTNPNVSRTQTETTPENSDITNHPKSIPSNNTISTRTNSSSTFHSTKVPSLLTNPTPNTTPTMHPPSSPPTPWVRSISTRPPPTPRHRHRPRNPNNLAPNGPNHQHRAIREQEALGSVRLAWKESISAFNFLKINPNERYSYVPTGDARLRLSLHRAAERMIAQSQSFGTGEERRVVCWIDGENVNGIKISLEIFKARLSAVLDEVYGPDLPGGRFQCVMCSELLENDNNEKKVNENDGSGSGMTVDISVDKRTVVDRRDLNIDKMKLPRIVNLKINEDNSDMLDNDMMTGSTNDESDMKERSDRKWSAIGTGRRSRKYSNISTVNKDNSGSSGLEMNESEGCSSASGTNNKKRGKNKIDNNKDKDREEAKKITQENRGYVLLERMGWRDGQGLGSDASGMQDPVLPPNVRPTRRGLGGQGLSSDASGIQDPVLPPNVRPTHRGLRGQGIGLDASGLQDSVLPPNVRPTHRGLRGQGISLDASGLQDSVLPPNVRPTRRGLGN